MRVLIGCESSGAVRRAFRARGHEAWSCDLLPADDGSEHHFQCDVLEVIPEGWDLGIFFPPCTYLCASGMHWTTRGKRDPQLTLDALEFVRRLLGCGIPKLALENPRGAIGSRIRQATQSIQPYEFGEDASKETFLWLTGLPELMGTLYIAPRIVASGPHQGKRRWANQTAAGQNRLTPSEDRWKLRSATYPGIAAAMAAQWGNEL